MPSGKTQDDEGFVIIGSSAIVLKEISKVQHYWLVIRGDVASSRGIGSDSDLTPVYSTRSHFLLSSVSTTSTPGLHISIIQRDYDKENKPATTTAIRRISCISSVATSVATAPPSTTTVKSRNVGPLRGDLQKEIC